MAKSYIAVPPSYADGSALSTRMRRSSMRPEADSRAAVETGARACRIILVTGSRGGGVLSMSSPLPLLHGVIVAIFACLLVIASLASPGPLAATTDESASATQG